MLNSVALIGRLTRDAKNQFTKSGTQMTRFTIAVDRWKKGETDFIPIVCFAKTAELTANLTKGERVAVDGKLQVDNTKTDDGWRTYVSVIANFVEFLSPKKTQEENKLGVIVDFDEDDLPF